MNNKQRGDWGEEAAAREYERRGFSIVRRNYKTPWGEIDIIAKNDVYLAFCEVKTRTGSRFGRPCEAVGISKRRKITLSARLYLSENDTYLQPRFDVCEVVGRGNAIKINLMENAFDEEPCHDTIF